MESNSIIIKQNQKMSSVLKQHLVEGTQIFFSGFIGVVAITISQGGVQWTSAFWSALLLAGIGAGVKELFAKFAPLAFGGRVGPTLLGRRQG